MKRIIAALAPIFVTGCAFTQQEAIKEMSPIYERQAQQNVQAKTLAVQAVMKALANIKRGGMDLELDKDGRVKAIHYREHLDEGMLREAMHTPEMHLPVPHAPAQDYAAFVGSLTNLVVPFAGMYYGYKTNKVVSETNRDIRINESNNNAKMYQNFTGNFQHDVTNYPPEYIIRDTNATE